MLSLSQGAGGGSSSWVLSQDENAITRRIKYTQLRVVISFSYQFPCFPVCIFQFNQSVWNVIPGLVAIIVFHQNNTFNHMPGNKQGIIVMIFKPIRIKLKVNIVVFEPHLNQS